MQTQIHDWRRAVIVASGLATAFCALAQAQQAGDWPQWRGPDGSGVSRETKWNSAALTGGAKIAWKASVGAGYSAVSVKGPRLYTMGNKDNADSVVCLNTADGAEVWRQSYPCKGGSYPGPRATPLVDGDVVYTVGRDGDVLCLDAAKGTIVWQVNITKDFGAQQPGWSHSASPSLLGDALVLNACRNGLAFDKKTGKKLWASPSDVCGYATPVFVGAAAKRQALIFGAKAMYGVDAATGNAIWSYPWQTGYDVNAADPLPIDDTIFITSGYGKGCALLKAAGSDVKAVWQNAVMKNHVGTPVYIDGHIYGIDGQVSDSSGCVVCMDAKTGAEKWRQKVGFASMMATTDKLIVLCERGDLIIADASPVAYKEVSRAKVLERAKSWTMPVLCGGMIYCRSDLGDLVAVDVRQ